MKKSLIKLSLVVACVTTSPLFGYTLKEAISETLNTHPEVQKYLRNYRVFQQDLKIAEAEYYPTLDFGASFGYAKAGMLKNSGDEDYKHTVAETDYKDYTTSLTLVQNLFDGFGTVDKIDYQEARILSAAYKYIEISNQTALDMARVYIDVLSANALVKTAEENVEITEETYNKVKDLYDSGLTTDSEVQKVQATLALARSNYTVQVNNAKDSKYKYRRILGRLPDVAELEKPTLDIKLPESYERAMLYAMQNNPSLIIANYDIKSAQTVWKQRNKSFYPTIDLELKQVFNDVDTLPNGYSQADDRFSARIQLSYNLFNGGADQALSRQNISKINQEVDIKRNLQRQLIEDLDLSWSAYEMLTKQLVDLREYSGYAEKTLTLYKEEYDLGRRTLLDLLAAQSDAVNSRLEIITAEYNQLFAEYRILDALGLLVQAVNGSAKEITSKVNLYTDEDVDAHFILDELPVSLDADGDNVVDNLDICNNSLKGNNIMPYGCKKIQIDDDNDGVLDNIDKCLKTPAEELVDEKGCPLDTDKDGVADKIDECPKTALGAPVNELGCELDGDKDGVQDYVDQCPNTPLGYKVDINGCAKVVTMRVNFSRNNSTFPEDSKEDAMEFTQYMINNPKVTARIVGYTSRTAVSKAEYNLKLSRTRAKVVMDEIIKNGISAGRLTYEGKGFENPIADNATEEGRIKNRRVEIHISRPQEKGEL